ncbi:hypothetical protein HD599_000599 [Conyzicola lurida]|uniref:Uncharacterized protein n=1 Tax=Conyzicola lurida TaxID=1172621 RepID=A0A841AKN7_9MICO|nr:hypothetical protein [Conyzicola lurida]MBB5842276.1 hypothetical protein [Conyzicola lurida]
MAWFKKKPTELERLAGIADDVQLIAMRRFGARGMPVTVLDGTSGLDAVLTTASGDQYPLHNLISRAIAGDLDDVPRLVTHHVDALVDAAAAPNSDQLSDDDWLENVRVRLMPADAATAVGAGYARTFAGGLVEMLCLDYPTHITYLSDAALEGRDPVELAAAGRAAVIADPVENSQEIDPGIWLVQGNSPYTATKALAFEHLAGSALPAAPHGIVFGVPHRHMIVAHAVDSVDSVVAISRLAQFVVAQATDSAPGGPLSSSIYFWYEGSVDVVGWVKDDGSTTISGDGRFGEVLAGLAK